MFSKLLKRRSKFYWFDVYTFKFGNMKDADVLPTDCIRVKRGTKINIYRNIYRGTYHPTIGGRSIPTDSMYGLFSESDFDRDTYICVKQIII